MGLVDEYGGMTLAAHSVLAALNPESKVDLADLPGYIWEIDSGDDATGTVAHLAAERGYTRFPDYVLKLKSPIGRTVGDIVCATQAKKKSAEMSQYTVEKILEHAESGSLPDLLVQDPWLQHLEHEHITELAKWAKERDYQGLPDGFLKLSSRERFSVAHAAAYDGFTGFKGDEWFLTSLPEIAYAPYVTVASILADRGYTGFPPEVWSFQEDGGGTVAHRLVRAALELENVDVDWADIPDYVWEIGHPAHESVAHHAAHHGCTQFPEHVWGLVSPSGHTVYDIVRYKNPQNEHIRAFDPEKQQGELESALQKAESAPAADADESASPRFT